MTKQRNKRVVSALARIGAVAFGVCCLIAIFRGCREKPSSLLSEATTEANERMLRAGVTLGVHEPSGVERKAEPVTSGVPLPEGAVKDTRELRLLDKDGKPVPCQFTPLCRWPCSAQRTSRAKPDGSLKWVLLDFQADVAPTGVVNYTLCAGGANPAPDKPVRVAVTADGFSIENSVLKVGIATNIPGILHSVEVGGVETVSKKDPVRVTLVDGDGKIYGCSKPKMVTVESEGPLRGTVLVTGEFVAQDGAKIFGGRLGYEARVTAYAGKRHIKLEFMLRNDGSYYGKNRQWLFCKSMTLAVPPATARESEECKATLCGKEVLIKGAESFEMAQWYKYPARNARGHEELRFSDETEREAKVGMGNVGKGFYHCVNIAGDNVGAAGKPRGAPGKLAGFAELGDGQKTHVGIAARRFPQNFPAGFRAERGQLCFVVLPEGGFWPRNKEAHDKGTYQFEGGRHKR